MVAKSSDESMQIHEKTSLDDATGIMPQTLKTNFYFGLESMDNHYLLEESGTQHQPDHHRPSHPRAFRGAPRRRLKVECGPPESQV
jgi:hypothetical protein